MNISDVKEGMKVRISDDLTKTAGTWTLDGDGIMEAMKGNIYKVSDVRYDRNGVTVFDPEYNEHWIFCSEDVFSLKMTEPKEAVMFDPDNISVGD